MNTNTSYIHSLTPLRGIAALWVVLFHIDVCTFYRELGGLLPRAHTGIFSQGYLWVDFFFILSGFIIAHVYGKQLAKGIDISYTKKFLWARFSRIYPLHFFTTSLLVLATLIAPKFTPEIVDGSWNAFFNWSFLPGQFLLINAMTKYHALTWNIPSWSIGAEWWSYLLAIGIFPLLFIRKKRVIAISMCISFLFLTALVYLHPFS